MKLKIVVLTALVLSLSVAACSSPESPPAESEAAQNHAPVATEAAKEFDVAELKTRLDAGEKLFLLDVRRPEELVEHGAIAGYVNIPIDELESRLAEVPQDVPVVTYCMRGGRASRAAKLLEENGHSGIQYGGITAWKEAGHDVVYPAGAQPPGGTAQ